MQLEDLGDVDIALGPHFFSKCGPSAMSTSPRSSSSSRYHEVNKKEVSRDLCRVETAIDSTPPLLSNDKNTLFVVHYSFS